MRKTFKYRIYPNGTQIKTLESTLKECMNLYNATLALKKDAWANDGNEIPFYQTNKLLTEWKKRNLFSKEIHSKVLQNVQERVDVSFKSFQKRLREASEPVSAQFPRFKETYSSITYNQTGFSIDKNILKLSKIGNIKIRKHREIEGIAKRLHLKRQSSGKWFACLEVEIEEGRQTENLSSIGIYMNDKIHCPLDGLIIPPFKWGNLSESFSNLVIDIYHKKVNLLVKRYGNIFYSHLGEKHKIFEGMLINKAKEKGCNVYRIDIGDDVCPFCGHDSRDKKCRYCDKESEKYRNDAVLRAGVKFLKNKRGSL